MMKALTLWQPWAWAIAHAGKRIENRSWSPPDWIIAQRLAIHAGQTIERDSVLALGAPQDQLVTGAVVAVVTVKGWIAKPRSAEQARWFSGPKGWVLDDVVALPNPVPCNGARRLWELPYDVDAEVRRQLASLTQVPLPGV
jgi:hypothetical protein